MSASLSLPALLGMDERLAAGQLFNAFQRFDGGAWILCVGPAGGDSFRIGQTDTRERAILIVGALRNAFDQPPLTPSEPA